MRMTGSVGLRSIGVFFLASRAETVDSPIVASEVCWLDEVFVTGSAKRFSAANCRLYRHSFWPKNTTPPSAITAASTPARMMPPVLTMRPRGEGLDFLRGLLPPPRPESPLSGVRDIIHRPRCPGREATEAPPVKKHSGNAPRPMGRPPTALRFVLFMQCPLIERIGQTTTEYKSVVCQKCRLSIMPVQCQELQVFAGWDFVPVLSWTSPLF